jgi:hypothetical protein
MTSSLPEWAPWLLGAAAFALLPAPLLGAWVASQRYQWNALNPTAEQWSWREMTTGAAARGFDLWRGYYRNEARDAAWLHGAVLRGDDEHLPGSDLKAWFGYVWWLYQAPVHIWLQLMLPGQVRWLNAQAGHPARTWMPPALFAARNSGNDADIDPQTALLFEWFAAKKPSHDHSKCHQRVSVSAAPTPAPSS